MTLPAQATQLPRAPGCPELLTVTKFGDLRAPRQDNLEPAGSPRWKLRSLKGLSQNLNPSRN